MLALSRRAASALLRCNPDALAPRLLAAAAPAARQKHSDAGSSAAPQQPAPQPPQPPQFVADAQARTEEELRRLVSRVDPKGSDGADEAEARGCDGTASALRCE
jgi:hypothetical protein